MGFAISLNFDTSGCSLGTILPQMFLDDPKYNSEKWILILTMTMWIKKKKETAIMWCVYKVITWQQVFIQRQKVRQGVTLERNSSSRIAGAVAFAPLSDTLPWTKQSIHSLQLWRKIALEGGSKKPVLIRCTKYGMNCIQDDKNLSCSQEFIEVCDLERNIK